MTPADLYDYLQRTFGIGNWDEATSTMPWWRFRLTEIAKLKAMLKKRGATPEHVITTAEYAIEQRRSIFATYQLFLLIPEAMAAQRAQARTDRNAQLNLGIEEALAEAIALGETQWAERFMRASAAEAQIVINEWRTR